MGRNEPSTHQQRRDVYAVVQPTRFEYVLRVCPLQAGNRGLVSAAIVSATTHAQFVWVSAEPTSYSYQPFQLLEPR